MFRHQLPNGKTFTIYNIFCFLLADNIFPRDQTCMNNDGQNNMHTWSGNEEPSQCLGQVFNQAFQTDLGLHARSRLQRTDFASNELGLVSIGTDLVSNGTDLDSNKTNLDLMRLVSSPKELTSSLMLLTLPLTSLTSSLKKLTSILIRD
ncbi:hypothetical protein BgiBS90_008730 [Biomphalaria glabrata]|nr:hypothetical protein BgiBS90_008730 [Biomphalaria glabrata]